MIRCSAEADSRSSDLGVMMVGCSGVCRVLTVKSVKWVHWKRIGAVGTVFWVGCCSARCIRNSRSGMEENCF